MYSNTILQQITDYLNLRDQLAVLSMNKHTCANLYIKKLTSNKITQSVILQHKYSKMEILDVYNNPNIYDINHLSQTLVELNCGGYTNSLSDEGVNELTNLKFLNIYDNNKVKHLKNFTLLEGLNCGGGLSQISQKNISDLGNLKYLNIYGNDKIVNLNLLKKLEKLNCGSFYPKRMNINQEGIRELNNLKIIYAENNDDILQHNINNIFVNNKCYDNSDLFNINIMDNYITNWPSYRKRFDELKKEIIKMNDKFNNLNNNV